VGAPDSTAGAARRAAWARTAAAPGRERLARAAADRLRHLPADGGVVDAEGALAPLDETPLPAALRRIVLRAVDASPAWHVERGTITSGELLARVIPQRTARVGAAGIEDPALRRLYGAVYAAFRRRRSLLLVNLAKQVQLEELPWVAVLEPFRGDDGRAAAREALAELVLLALRAFPHTILPNKLLQELGALARQAGLALPLVEEVAADIFMGEFTEKYLRAAQRAGELLRGTLYETYYGIDYARVRALDDVDRSRHGARVSPGFAALCRERAGEPGRGSVARNGKVIEQEQVLTTHNLAVLVAGLDLRAALAPELGELARRTFTWCCAVHRARARAPWLVRLRGCKDVAYAWRQMVFFLSLAPAGAVEEHVAWARAQLSGAPPVVGRLAPAVEGLALAARGVTPGDDDPAARRLLGWATGRHWLLAE
jgi:hypothetical protein